MMQTVVLFGCSHDRLFALAQQYRMICNGHTGHVGVAKTSFIFEAKDVPIKALRLFEIIHRDGPVRNIVEFQHTHTYLLALTTALFCRITPSEYTPAQGGCKSSTLTTSCPSPLRQREPP